MQFIQTNEELEFVLTENMDKTYEKHSHVSKYIVGMVLDGSVLLENQGGKTIYAENDIFFVPVCEIHSLQIENNEARILSICIGLSFIQKYPIEEALTLISGYLRELVEKNILKNDQLDILNDYLHMIINDIYISVALAENIKDSDDIEQIKELMVQSPEQELDIEYLSGQVYLSKYYMIRKFKNDVGLTPHKFLLQNRIRKAQRLLQRGLKVADVAAEMGFYDQSHFVKSFRKIMKIPPEEYLQSVKKID